MGVSPAYLLGERPSTHVGGPTWDVAYLFPAQGKWSERDYLALDTNRLAELIDGRLEVLPLPTIAHQLIVAFLLRQLHSFVTSRGLGEVIMAPLPMRLGDRHYRTPDLLLLRSTHISGRDYPEGADLIVEVMNDDVESRRRDSIEKPIAYALAGIPEFWFIDPEQQSVTVLALDGKEYRTHGEFKAGQMADSPLLPGFGVDVAELFAAGKVS